jgi:hypothetical protein
MALASHMQLDCFLCLAGLQELASTLRAGPPSSSGALAMDNSQTLSTWTSVEPWTAELAQQMQEKLKQLEQAPVKEKVRRAGSVGTQ